MAELRSVDEHLAEVLRVTPHLDAITLPLAHAAGHVLASAVLAAVDIPVFDNSAMDGFAVRHRDVAAASASNPITLRVIADLPAGTDANPELGEGEAARIMTGSPVPDTADAIVPFEHTSGGLEDSLRTVTVLQAPAPHAHIRVQGGDLRAGATVVDHGTIMGALQLSSVAASGVASVSVARRPRVAVIATGSELVQAGAPLQRGQIPESNGALLASLAREAGADIVLQELVDDTDEAFLDVLRRAEHADAIITSGGVSAGAFEVVKNALAGSSIAFTKVAMQPGKPQGFGVLPSGALLFALPGNPVSSAVSFDVFVRPALLRMQGSSRIHRPLLRLRTTTGWRTPPGRTQYVPIAFDRADPAAWRIAPATAGGSGSHLAGGLARAEGYAIVPAEVSEVHPGDPLDVMLLL